MNSAVNLEVILLAKDLTTARKRTLEWLSPSMDMHVGLKAGLSCVGLATARMLTSKNLRLLDSIKYTTRTFVFGFLLGLRKFPLLQYNCVAFGVDA